jgi:hypothetical protein
MCRLLSVSLSGYYQAGKRPHSLRQQVRMALANDAKRFFDDEKGEQVR